MTLLPEDRLAELHAHLLAGEKIAAIKLYRELAHVDLKEAKDAVEAIEADLRASSPERFAPARSGCAGGAAALLLCAAALAWAAHHLIA